MLDSWSVFLPLPPRRRPRLPLVVRVGPAPTEAPVNPRLRLRRHLADLERARDALAEARASRADPWRVAELQLRYDRLNERVMAVEFDESLPPCGRGPAPRVPLPPEGRRRG